MHTACPAGLRDLAESIRDAGLQAGRCVLQVTSPIIKAPLAEGQPAAAARFSGNLYLKCLSLASAIEWILCDSLR